MNKIIFGMLVFFSCAAKGPNYVNNRNREQRMKEVIREGKSMQRKMEKARRRAGRREKSSIDMRIRRPNRKYV